MANFVCFLAARAAKATRRADSRAARHAAPLRVYASTETHTWIQKAADLFGLGTDAIRWIAVDAEQRMDVAALERQIVADRDDGALPFLVVGTAGTVSTGAVDPLAEIAAVCRRHDVWFHVDGAYGALAARVPGAPDESARAQRSRFRGRRSAQVALRAARSRLRAGAAAAAICCARSRTIRATTTSTRR